jgi:hypothetical protein
MTIFAAGCLIALVATATAGATPAVVNVRIEGRSETLFEGPIWTEGHDIKASSDTQERSCDGINPNDPQNLTPGPTPTGASVDAMSLIGETFDGRWYGGYDDYFITRWGSDREEEGMSWGVLVNNVFTAVGGCQYELGPGEEVLWAYDAFAAKPFLALFAAGEHYTSGTRPLTATAELGRPFTVEVLDYDDDKEDVPPAAPQRTGAIPYGGAEVSPVQTSAKGFEQVQTASPDAVTTDAEGKASVIFTTPGWHRIKASAVNGQGEETAIRSNRLDVCVPAEGSTTCPEPLPEDGVRTPPRYAQVEQEEEHREETKVTGTGGNSAGGQPSLTGAGMTPPLSLTPHTTGHIDRAVGLTVMSISPAWLLLKFTAAGEATVRIARLQRIGHHRYWPTVKTIAVEVSRAGQVKVKLPRLAAGHYRVSIYVADGESVASIPIVARK